MKNAFVLSSVIIAIVLVTTAASFTSFVSLVLNNLPLAIGGYSAAAVIAMACDDYRRHIARQRTTRTLKPTRSIVKDSDPAYAGGTWGFNTISA
jgi:hypothetical protein